MSVTVTKRMIPLLNSSDVTTGTNEAGKKFCRIRMGNHPLPNKPITFLLSSDDNLVEDYILRHTMFHLARRFGSLPAIDIYSAHNDLVEQERCFNDIRRNQNNHGAVVGLSSWMSAGAHRYLAMDGFNVPTLFANVSPTQQKRMKQHSMVNGIGTQVQNYERQLTTIKDLLPGLRRLLIPRDIVCHESRSGGGVINDNIKSLIAECEKQNIEPILMSVCPQNSVPVDIRQYRSTDTMFMITRDNSVLSQMAAIIKTCNGHRMPIFSDLPLPTLHGAAFGTGNSGVNIAEPLAEMIFQVVGNGLNPDELGNLTVEESNLLLFNQLNFAAQGIQVSDEQMRLLEAQHIALFARNAELI